MQLRIVRAVSEPKQRQSFILLDSSSSSTDSHPPKTNLELVNSKAPITADNVKEYPESNDLKFLRSIAVEDVAQIESPYVKNKKHQMNGRVGNVEKKQKRKIKGGTVEPRATVSSEPNPAATTQCETGRRLVESKDVMQYESPYEKKRSIRRMEGLEMLKRSRSRK
jgi:hypothetical protein